MKRTSKILSLVALLLVAVTLLSSCGINYRKTDVSKYVTIGETGYKGVTLEVNKTIISDRDIDKELFALQYNNRTVVDEKKDASINKSKIKQYDTLALRLAIYDSNNNLVFSQFGLDSSKYNATESTIAAVSGLSFNVGYGEFGRTDVTLDSTKKITLPVDFLNSIEKAVYGDEATHTLIDDFLIEGRWQRNDAGEKTGAVNNTMDTPFAGFFSVSYLPSYTKEGSSSAILGSVTAPVTIDTYLYANKSEAGKNDFQEAIYKGLEAYAAKMKENGLPLTCGKQVIIHVVPVGATLTDDERTIKNDLTNSSYTDQVVIEYNLDFESPTSGENYKRGKITTTILFAYAYGAATLGDTPTYVEPLTLTFTPGDTYEGEYKVGSATEKMAGKDFTVRIFVEERTAYEMPELTAQFIKDKASHASHMDDLTGTDEEVIAKYKAHLKEEMQADADKQALKDAKEALWKKVVASAKEGEKSSASFAKKYMKEEVEYLKYMYYDYQSGAYKALADSYEKFAVMYVNWGFESHYTELLETYLEAGSDGSYQLPLADTTDASYKAAYSQLESIFYKQGLAVAKERALVYLLADKLGIRLSDDELEAKLEAAVKKADEDAKETIRDMITVDEGETTDEVKTELKNALKSLGIGETTLKDMTVEQLAKHYLLQYYSVSSYDELPKELVTRKSYLSQVDKEGLFGGYQLETLKNKLFETNESTITFVDVDTDGNKLDKDTDGE